MKPSLKKIFFLVSGLTLFASLITTAHLLISAEDVSQFARLHKTAALASVNQKSASTLLNSVGQSGNIKGILLPLGPDDSRLPGVPAIWKNFYQEGAVDADRVNADGFDGFQAVANIADLSKGSIAELFLSGPPLQAFLRGRFILTLNGFGNVQIVDCTSPREPKLSGSLSYRNVKQMEMQGDIAFLQISPLGVQHDTMIVVDLRNPLSPQELSRFRLPLHTRSCFLLERHLLVYTNPRGYKGESRFHMYGFADDFRFIHLDAEIGPPIGSALLKSEGYLLTSDVRGGLNIFDFNDPLHPFLAASLSLPDQIKQLSRHGDVVYALGTQKHIYAIDLHDPLRPVLSAVVEEANYAATFMNFGHYSYYFTENGYLQVFDAPRFDASAGDDQWHTAVAGELVSTSSGEGFTLLGNQQGPLPAVVTDVLTLPDETHIVDTLFWKDFLVLLDADGLLQFFRNDNEASLEFKESLQLLPAKQWIAVSSDRLYIGGKSGISVIAKGDDDHFILSGQVEFTAEESWDGLVVNQTLCVAAGKSGVVSFSVEQPDHPAVMPGWTIPRQWESRVDVRQLATPGGDRLLTAAGSVGLLSGRIADNGQFQLDGFINFQAPLYALTVIGDFCLAATGAHVSVIDLKSRDSLQNLGKIAFSAVERFAVAAPGFWAGYVSGQGWSLFPAPHLLLPDETALPETSHSGKLTAPFDSRYRLNVFDDHNVISIPGILTFPAASGKRVTGVMHGVH